ncbi:MAG: hypothetical protein GY903_32355 [Fuerstiella sp.]|nr:hypothetical protein [Fuerstiella sp.]
MNDVCRCDRLHEAVPGDVTDVGYGRSFIGQNTVLSRSVAKNVGYMRDLANTWSASRKGTYNPGVESQIEESGMSRQISRHDTRRRHGGKRHRTTAE